LVRKRTEKKGAQMKQGKNQRRIRIRAIRREPLDVQKLGTALLSLAMAQAQAEADAEAEHEKAIKEDPRRAA
jgi:hypothetical protein